MSLPAFSRLQLLLLVQQPISDLGLHGVVESLTKLKSLKMLNFYGCTMISGTAFKTFAGCHMPSIKRLNLGRTGMDSDGMSTVAQQMISLPGLRVLCFTGCLKFGAAGVEALAKQLPLGL